jgi:hypothetical protein
MEQDVTPCANITEPSQSRPAPTGADLSAVREDVPRHAFIEKSFVWMSSLAIEAVVRTRKHRTMNSIKPHDHRSNLLIMVTFFAADNHNRQKRARIYQYPSNFSSHNEHSMWSSYFNTGLFGGESN